MEFLFSFASPSRIENISILCIEETSKKQIVEEAASGMVELIYKRLSRGHTGYRLLAKEYKKIWNGIWNAIWNGKEKTASSELIGVKWCDIHKEWYE